MERFQKIVCHETYKQTYERLQELEKDREFCGHDMEHFLSVARISYLKMCIRDRHNMAKVTIEVEAAKLDDAIKQAFNKKKGQFNVPGFRKGKVPFQLIAKEYGVEIFYEDAANILIPDAYAEAMKDTDLEIVSRPEIDVTQLEKGKDFIFTATFALKPEVTLGDYKGIEVPKTRVTVKKDEIEEELKKVQEQNAREITIEDLSLIHI